MGFWKCANCHLWPKVWIGTRQFQGVLVFLGAPTSWTLHYLGTGSPPGAALALGTPLVGCRRERLLRCCQARQASPELEIFVTGFSGNICRKVLFERWEIGISIAYMWNFPVWDPDMNKFRDQAKIFGTFWLIGRRVRNFHKRCRLDIFNMSKVERASPRFFQWHVAYSTQIPFNHRTSFKTNPFSPSLSTSSDPLRKMMLSNLTQILWKKTQKMTICHRATRAESTAWAPRHLAGLGLSMGNLWHSSGRN